MSTWTTVPLGELIEIFDSQRIPLSAAQRSTRNGPFPYYGAQGVIDYIDDYIFDGRFILVPEDGENLRSRRLPIAYFAEGKFWVNNHAHIVRSKPERAVDRFIQGALEASYIDTWITGAAQPKLSQANLRKIPISVPSLAEQHSIAAVLDALDDMIENNRRRVEVLEEMARAIYREWFVEFRYPGHEDVPLIDSALGPIPEGWVPRSVREVSAVVVRGISPKYADDGEWTVINQKCIRDGRVSLGKARRQERAVSETKRIRSGDVLINSTGVGTLGRVAMYRGDSSGVTVDSHVTICRPAEDSLNPWFAMALLAQQGEIERMGAGATGQTELRKSDVEELELVQPAAPVMRTFASVVLPILAQVDLLLAEIDTTSALRDRLLPKLVTGQIDVSTLDLDAVVSTGSTGGGGSTGEEAVV